MKQRTLFCLYLILHYTNDCLCDVTAEKNLKLQMVQVLFRHGFRTPTQTEALYIGFNDSRLYEPEGFEQLTKTGKLQLHNLGSVLRERYDEFLGVYNYQDVYALSSDYARTKMSLQLVLSGLFTPSTEQTWNKKLNWIPIPSRYIKVELDATFTPHNHPKFEEILDVELSNSVDFQGELSNHSDFVRYIEEKTGISFKTRLVYHAGWTYYALTAHKVMNLPLPSWYTDELFAALKDLFILGLDSMSYTQKLKRLNGGTMIRRFLEDMDRNREVKRKIYLYSGHDLTLAGFTRAHGIETFKLPYYGSAVIVEKHEDANNGLEYLKMYAWDALEEKMLTLKIKDCEDVCPLDKYRSITKDVTPSDEDLDMILGR